MKSFLSAVLIVLSLFGCSSIVSTNESAKVPLPTIATADSLANYEIKELVKGQACVTKTLGIINSGDKAFIESSGQTRISAVERAKAAASYNALSKDGLTNDILVNPVWEIHENNSFFVQDVCARVIGYRGVIKSFTQLDTFTKPNSNKSSFQAPIEKRVTNSHFDSQAQETIISSESRKAEPSHAEQKEATKEATKEKPGQGHGHEVHWGYEGENGPEHWGENFPMCGSGKSQSPLNIVGPFEKSRETLMVDYVSSPLKILNNGHTIQVIPAPGSKVMINKEVYELLQFHFHRPSEEKIDGKGSAMVIHFVHKSKDGKLAVIGVLIEEGKENAAIKTLWNNLPPKVGEEFLPSGVEFDPTSLIPLDTSHFTYEGSLTTPPCTEGVMFYIMKTPVEVSKAQVNKFPFKLNARPVQKLNTRKISSTS